MLFRSRGKGHDHELIQSISYVVTNAPEKEEAAGTIQPEFKEEGLHCLTEPYGSMRLVFPQLFLRYLRRILGGGSYKVLNGLRMELVVILCTLFFWDVFVSAKCHNSKRGKSVLAGDINLTETTVVLNLNAGLDLTEHFGIDRTGHNQRNRDQKENDVPQEHSLRGGNVGLR